MSVFIIGYDLTSPRKADAYDKLEATVKGLASTYWHRLDSTWMVVSDLTCAEIRDKIQAIDDAWDRVLVIQLYKGINWAAVGFSDYKWIREQLVP